MHIPFCRQACTYCNFHFTTSLRYKDEMVRALGLELLAEKDYLQGETVNTIYFGGGTPSLLSIEDLHGLLAATRRVYPVAPDAEITLEANPDDISSDRLKAWLKPDWRNWLTCCTDKAISNGYPASEYWVWSLWNWVNDPPEGFR